jgi:L-asparaginase/Glu-tRNA(Gln) amidotransferase subunit D
MPRQPRIALISYGGTIASGQAGVGATPSASMSEIAAHIPELGAFELIHQPSRALTAATCRKQ